MWTVQRWGRGCGWGSAALHPQLCAAGRCSALSSLAISQHLPDAELSVGSPADDHLLFRVESMSLADRGNPGNVTSRLVEKEKARDCLIPMG